MNLRRCVGVTAGAVALSTLLLACGGAPLPLEPPSALRAAIASRASTGELRVSDVQRAAFEIAEREVQKAKTLTEMKRFWPCAKSLKPVLTDLAERQDEAGAAAAMTLWELGLERRDLSRHADHPISGWRAIAARGLSRDAGVERRSLLVDPDQDVRLAALRASIDAHDADDVPILLDAARRDPLPLGRTLAVRALGNIADDSIPASLAELWQTADAPLRQAIAEAWGSASHAHREGSIVAERILSSGGGGPAIAGAAALIRSRVTPAWATALLRSSVAQGSTAERTFALAMIDLGDPDNLAAVLKAAADSDAAISSVALIRLLDADSEKLRLDARDRLLARAHKPKAQRVRAALAASRVDAVLPHVMKAAADYEPAVREAAAADLLALGKMLSASVLLADRDAHVRTSVACRILSEP